MALPGVHPGPSAAPDARAPAPQNPAPPDRADAPPPRPPLLRRLARAIATAIDRTFGALSMVLLLSIAVTLPVVQFFALGVLLRAAARVAETGRLREAFAGVPQASRLGQTAIALFILTAPSRLFLSLRDDALLLDPGGQSAPRLHALSLLTGALAVLLGLLGVYQGGRVADFVRPIRGLRRFAADARERGLAARTLHRARAFVRAFEIPSSFWLGLRGYLGAAAWLIAPSTLLAVGRASPLPLIGAALLAAVVVRVPFLQVHFAVHNDINRMFDIRGEMDLFARAPLSFLVALASTLLLSLPLYLLKIEIVPRDALWLPAAIFLITIFPVKIMTGWAYHRALRRPAPAHPVWQWIARILMTPVALLYALLVFVTPLTGWHGRLGLYEHHAFLLPVPF